MDIYREQILDHYKNPHNWDKMSSAEVVVKVANEFCGDEIEMYLKTIKKKGRLYIEKVSFQGEGCAISMASASMLTDYVKGKSVEKMKDISVQKVISLLGITLSPLRMKCALLSREALLRAIAKLP